MEYRKISDLKKLENNPRTVKGREFKDLRESLKRNPRFFEARPIILSDRTGELIIIAGNTKYEAAKANKLKEVPTELISGLTEEQEREIVIRDNTHAGKWDFDILANQFGDLPLSDFGIELPKDWLGTDSDSDGTMRNVFNSGKGVEEELGTEGPAPDKFPVTFVLDQSEWEAWKAVKSRLKIQDDKSAFLKLIGGDHA